MEGRCPKCGARYFGEALRMCQNQMCGYCGCGLEIKDEQGQTFAGYSPFTAAEYKLADLYKKLLDPLIDKNK